jgi:hypothetical protein
MDAIALPQVLEARDLNAYILIKVEGPAKGCAYIDGGEI